MLRRLQGQARTVANHLFLPITSGKSASVYECFPFIWPYNAHPVLLKELRQVAATKTERRPRPSDFGAERVDSEHDP